MRDRAPIAVLGATGNQGGHVARALLDAGWPVRVVTRNPDGALARALTTVGAECRPAEMEDVAALSRAFAGCHGVFSVQNFWVWGMDGEVRLGTHVIEAARGANVSHLMLSSGLGAEQKQGVEAIDGKAILEERLRASGLPFTILRPGLFMEDFLGASLPFAPPLQRILRHHRPLVGQLLLTSLSARIRPNRRVPLVSLNDLGRMAVWACEHPNASIDQSFKLVGSVLCVKRLCSLWERAGGKKVWHLPGAGIGLNLVNPKMAHLLDWLGQQDFSVVRKPLTLTPFEAWCEANLRI